MVTQNHPLLFYVGFFAGVSFFKRFREALPFAISLNVSQCRLLTGSPEHFRLILNGEALTHPSPKEKDFDAQRKTAFFKPLSLGEGFGVRRTRCQAQILIP